jgi:hypothetical protein
VPHSLCPARRALVISVRYPKDTGNAKVDGFFAGYAGDFARGAKEDPPDLLTGEGFCEFEGDFYANLDFQAHRPTPATLGVLLVANTYQGGAHESLDYRALNFDLATGRELQVQDLFPSPARGIAGLFLFASSELCRAQNGHDAAWNVLGGDCRNPGQPPQGLLSQRGPLGGLGNLVLTRDGAELNFGPYDLWSWSQGPFVLKVPKGELLGMGARDLWDAP